jgi:hypothetical protein
MHAHSRAEESKEPTYFIIKEILTPKETVLGKE